MNVSTISLLCLHSSYLWSIFPFSFRRLFTCQHVNNRLHSQEKRIFMFLYFHKFSEAFLQPIFLGNSEKCIALLWRNLQKIRKKQVINKITSWHNSKSLTPLISGSFGFSYIASNEPTISSEISISFLGELLTTRLYLLSEYSVFLNFVVLA